MQRGDARIYALSFGPNILKLKRSKSDDFSVINAKIAFAVYS